MYRELISACKIIPVFLPVLSAPRSAAFLPLTLITAAKRITVCPEVKCLFINDDVFGFFAYHSFIIFFCVLSGLGTFPESHLFVLGTDNHRKANQLARKRNVFAVAAFPHLGESLGKKPFRIAVLPGQLQLKDISFSGIFHHKIRSSPGVYYQNPPSDPPRTHY